MGNLRIHPYIHEIAEIFEKNNKQVFLVGGAVRDLLRGKKVQDWDIASDAHPEDVIRFFRRVIPTGIKHGTVTILYKGLSVETTSFRTESGYSDNRRPDRISYAATIEEDLSRRDFTMNAIALRISDGTLVDPYEGVHDIKRRIIRCVGNPLDRFMEDGLRPLRGIRFSAQLNFSINRQTLDAIPAVLDVCARVSAERIRVELDKILASTVPSRAFLLMEQTGMLTRLLPELMEGRGIEQKGFHKYDVLDHLLYCCDAAPANRPVVRMAALLHDVGKPRVRSRNKRGGWAFYRHEEVSADMAELILKRLKYPNAFIDKVCHLISIHMFHYEESWTDAAVRRFIARAGEENLSDLYALHRADNQAISGIPASPLFNMALSDRVERILAEGRAFTVKDLAVNGSDLAAAGIPKNKRMGIILGELLETVLDDPEMNTKEQLIKIAGKLNERYLD